ncbi:DUF4349 domain-containing protein [Cohnella sp. CFH 77786]|uniref:DUF4349 domain-containing protein n=1 Tax=Cohnella sp. CFH 77786 TaxID=2662265 RepID=UPI001C60C3EE|nr:DUF4349 domain-containing protein [Cohnella sp. CFH 77786]
MSTRKKVGGRRNGIGRLAAMIGSLALMLAFAAACSSKSDDSGAEAPEAAAPAEQAANAMASSSEQGAASKSFANAPSAQVTVQDQASSSQSAQAGADVGGIGPIADPDMGTNRKVIYKANVSMKVPDYDAAEEKLKDAIHLSGSYVLQFNNTLDASGKGATYVIKVPADGFSPFIERLRDIQKDLQLQMEGSDVTEEFVDLTARLQAKKTVEARLLSFMDKATKTDDLVRFSNELAAVQEQIEQIKGRMRYLDQNVAYSTVNVRMYEGTEDMEPAVQKDKNVGQRMADALSGSAKALGQIGEALLVFASALLPILALAAVIGVPAYFIVRSQRRTRREAAEQKRKEWNARASLEAALEPVNAPSAAPGAAHANDSADEPGTLVNAPSNQERDPK